MYKTDNISSIQLFSEFFHENQEKFLSFAYSYIRDKQEAEDILMESMITLWENRDKWEEDSNLHALLLTIIKNKALNYLAHIQVRLRAEEEITTHRQRELDLRISTLEDCEPDTIFNAEIQHIVQKALKHMPEQSRKKTAVHCRKNVCCLILPFSPIPRQTIRERRRQWALAFYLC